MAAIHKILMVEDNAELCEMYRNFIKSKGYDVNVAFDGEQAIAVAKSYKPDLIFLDIMMPKKDGYEVLKTLRSDPSLLTSQPKIIMLTNLGQDSTLLTPDVKKIMDGYLVKAEVSLDDLISAIKTFEK